MKSPLITMSAITGNPSRDDIYGYMASVKAVGIDGVMLYARSGCEIEYLGDEWFEKIGYFIESAERLDVEIWLYDDFNWPSGHAGGRVTEIEEYRLKAIKSKGDRRGTVSNTPTLKGSLFGEKFFPDLLSHKAVEYFIECTHEKYYKYFGKYFGRVIKGFFTDEPAISYCCDSESIPYYDGMEEDYRRCYNRSFTEDMENEYPLFYKNSSDLIGERFSECFIKKLSQWCEGHGILLTGHLMNDETPPKSTLQSGNFLKALSGISIPGVDDISTNFKSPHLLSLLGGAEYASGKNGAMAELFALGPCDMPYAKKRCMIYLASAFKVNRYFLAVSHLDKRGNRYIKDYFNDFSADQPDFDGMRLLAEEAKTASTLAKKDFTPDVFIKYPHELCAARLLEQTDTNPFRTLINTLSQKQIQWKFTTNTDKSIPTIEFVNDKEYRLGGLVTSDAECLCREIGAKPILTDTDGNLPKGMLVRKYNDGTILAISMYANADTYNVDGKMVYIDTNGVYLSSSEETKITEREAVNTCFSLNFRRQNITRPIFLNGEKVSTVITEDDIDVTLAVRKDLTAKINNGKVITNADAELLPTGFARLYSSSPSLTLNKGENQITSDGDIKYLPSVFVIGDFRAKHSVCGDRFLLLLGSREKEYRCGEYFSDFGEVEFSATVSIPEGAKGLEITGTELYTSIYVDGALMGERICSPYVFLFDEHKKEINITIVQKSSIAPIFADVGYFEAHSTDTKWKGTPLPADVKFGFKEINWIW